MAKNQAQRDDVQRQMIVILDRNRRARRAAEASRDDLAACDGDQAGSVEHERLGCHGRGLGCKKQLATLEIRPVAAQDNNRPTPA